MANGTSTFDLVATGVTAFAACAALTIPFLQDGLRARSDRRAFVGIVREILRAVEDVVASYERALNGSRRGFGTSDQEMAIRDASERALTARYVLEQLLKRPNLTDGIVRCAVDAQFLAKEVELALDRVGSEPLPSERLERWLLKQSLRQKRVTDGLVRLKEHHKAQ